MTGNMPAAEKLRLRTQEALSTALHVAPGGLRRIVQTRLGLGGAHDDLLHWRVAKNSYLPDEWWASVAGYPEATSDPRTWGSVVLTVPRRAFEDSIGCGGRPAVAYRSEDHGPVMIGVDDLGAHERGNFLRPVDNDLRFDPEGRRMAVAMRVGPDAAQLAIGTASINGRYFNLLETSVNPVGEVPEGLRRVSLVPPL